MKLVKVIYYVGALLLLSGAALRLALPELYSYIYISGAVLFAVTQFLLRPRHSHFAVRRLVIQQQLGGIFFIAAGILMFTHSNNEWLPVLLCGAIAELYTAYRLPVEIEKHKDDR